MDTPARRPDRGGMVMGLGMLVLAGAIWWDLSGLQLTSVYGIGPSAMPIMVAAGLTLLGLLNILAAFRGSLPAREPVDRTAIILILGGLAALIGLVALGGGFIPATAVLFATVAAGFGRRAFVTDLIIGLVIGLVVYLVFSKLLGLSLPAGPIERLF